MREALKAAASLAWAMPLFGMSQIARTVSGGNGSPRESAPAPMPRHDGAANTGRLDLSRIVVLGEGLAAGVGDFGLSEESQHDSFVAQAARQAGAPFVIPALQAPGIYTAPGLAAQPVVLPHLLQTFVVGEFPLRRYYNNLAIPSYELADCLRRRPEPPLVHRDDPRQTAANLVLGLPALTTNPAAPRPTQLEYALNVTPTLAIVELGYAEALRLMTGEAGGPTDIERWAREYDDVVAALRGCGAEVVAATIPNPLDTAGCLPLDACARTLRVTVEDLRRRYRLDERDSLTIAGVSRAAFDLLSGAGDDLGPHEVVRFSAAQTITRFVDLANAAIGESVDRHGGHRLDLHGLFRSVREHGVTLRDRLLSADLLGGFYTLNGVYPGATGHAVIANLLLRCLNDAFGGSVDEIAIDSVARADRVADYRPPAGAERSMAAAARPADTAPAPRAETTGDRGGATRRDAPAARLPLRLPPSLEMQLPLSRAASYHGDAIRVVDAVDEAEARFGSSGGVLFGGPVLFDSHLSGTLHIRFTPPENEVTHFQLAFEPLAGDDGVLSAPMFFRWPVRECRVVAEPNAVSGGTLNLATGEVTDLSVSVRYLNSALQALVSVNPGFPDQPIVFPGQYGSAWAKFEQRDDGLLDFTFYGSTFLPLGARFGGDVVRWALPFAGAPFAFASIPARGIALHPHLQLSTRDVEEVLEPGAPRGPVDLPPNTVRELTLFTRRSSFGDRFTLNTPELGGPATGRSHLLGRLLVQTGEPFGTAMPVAITLISPGGLLGQQPPSPLAALFPGRLSPGPVGHDEHLRFPTRNYFLDAVTLVPDPFDFAVGAVDLRSGRFVNELLHRGFIGQDLFFSLIRVEPRTPRESFQFRGPAAFERGSDGDPIFRFRGIVRIPYPAGFGFPAPDLTSAITVGEESVLDPYLWIRAARDRPSADVFPVARERVRSSTGEEFSFRLQAGDRAGQPLAFEYTNHDQRSTFRLETVSWLGRSQMRVPGGESDVFTFAGFGRWSKDPTGRAHQLSAQVAVGAEEYVSVQIDGGLVSNVNTRPADETAALP